VPTLHEAAIRAFKVEVYDQVKVKRPADVRDGVGTHVNCDRSPARAHLVPPR